MNYYGRIAHAIDYYIQKGYEWIDTPWIVPSSVRNMTFKGHKEQCYFGSLVGSAEQGFIHLMQQKVLKPSGLYVSAGPCFRFDDLGHANKHPYFFKVELCAIGTLEYSEMMQDALGYLTGKTVETPEGYDIELNGLEIGSYGSREVDGLKWSYGTGLAEPRYTEALELGNE